MVRMVDVAKEAGVSVKTVSRVLNNEPHVQDAMRRRVRAAITDLGYVPSASARSLRSSRSYAIMLMIHDTRSTFANTIQFGALQACQDLGYHLQLSMVGSDTLGCRDRLAAWFSKQFETGRPDGLVLVPPMSNNPIVGEALADVKLPVVRIGPCRQASPCVKIDDERAAYDMTRHLIAQGHERIAFIRGKEDQDATHLRYDGYVRAISEAGLSVDPSLVFPGFFDFESGFAAGTTMLALDQPPTAVFAANDDMAAGVIMAAHRRGVAVPDALSVAGFDDSDVAVRTWPAITTIRQPVEAIGKTAVETLVAAAGASERELSTQTLDYDLVLRKSTAPPAG